METPPANEGLASRLPKRGTLIYRRWAVVRASKTPGGFAVVAFHKEKKLTKRRWAELVGAGKLDGAIKKLKPVSVDGPWHALCDNEGFLASKESSVACKRAGVKLWRIPSKSPDLNPVERFWSWLKKKLRHMDLTDALRGKPALTKPAYRARVRGVLRSKKAQHIAKTYANSLRTVCKAVLKNRGAATGF